MNKEFLDLYEELTEANQKEYLDYYDIPKDIRHKWFDSPEYKEVRQAEDIAMDNRRNAFYKYSIVQAYYTRLETLIKKLKTNSTPRKLKNPIEDQWAKLQDQDTIKFITDICNEANKVTGEVSSLLMPSKDAVNTKVAELEKRRGELQAECTALYTEYRNLADKADEVRVVAMDAAVRKFLDANLGKEYTTKDSPEKVNPDGTKEYDNSNIDWYDVDWSNSENKKD